jgi:hypothetical protein
LDADRAQFVPALRAYLSRGLSGRAAGRDAWSVGDGAAAISASGSGRSTTLALAPSVAVARRLASGARVR